MILERFYSGIRKNENEFTTYLMLGATLREAVRPYLRDAVKAAVNRINGCFDSARKLKTHNPEVLCGFLESFPSFLSKTKINLPADHDPDKIPYDRLLDALMSPSMSKADILQRVDKAVQIMGSA